MADTEKLTAAELRRRALEHRRAAERERSPERRKGWITLAAEYERLADEMDRVEGASQKTRAN